jgi:hypothetical protein
MNPMLLREILIGILIGIVCYQIYLEYFCPKKHKSKNEKSKNNKNEIVNKHTQNKLEKNEETEVSQDEPEQVNNNDQNMTHPEYGNSIGESELGLVFMGKAPWSQVFIDTKNNKTCYGINISNFMNNKQLLHKWKEIVPIMLSEYLLIIPAEEEIIALAIANMILSNLSGNISIEDVMKKNLIQQSINKMSQYDLAVKKIKENIMSYLNPETSTDKEFSYSEDLATSEGDNNEELFEPKAPNEEMVENNDDEPVAMNSGSSYSFL